MEYPAQHVLICIILNCTIGLVHTKCVLILTSSSEEHCVKTKVNPSCVLYRPVADPDRVAPSNGWQFFNFDKQNFQNVIASGIGALSNEKSWIRHCKQQCIVFSEASAPVFMQLWSDHTKPK